MQIINERTSESGFVVDEITGDPIVNARDIIVHHKNPITTENVNDVAITLNPNNVIVVSQRTHNDIHARFGHSNNKRVFYVYGAPCAGKSTYVRSVKGNSDLVVDIDLLWQAVTAGNPYEKPDALKSNVFALKDMLIEQVRTRAGKWERAFIIDGGAVKSSRERIIKRLDAEPIYIDTDKETCLKRLQNDLTRTEAVKEQWRKYIDEWFENYVE